MSKHAPTCLRTPGFQRLPTPQILPFHTSRHLSHRRAPGFTSLHSALPSTRLWPRALLPPTFKIATSHRSRFPITLHSPRPIASRLYSTAHALYHSATKPRLSPHPTLSLMHRKKSLHRIKKSQILNLHTRYKHIYGINPPSAARFPRIDFAINASQEKFTSDGLFIDSPSRKCI